MLKRRHTFEQRERGDAWHMWMKRRTVRVAEIAVALLHRCFSARVLLVCLSCRAVLFLLESLLACLRLD
jgi:uncharacterized iron-regulated membrane protein